MGDFIVFGKEERREVLWCISRPRPPAPLSFLFILNALAMHNRTCARMSEEDKRTGRELAAYTLTLSREHRGSCESRVSPKDKRERLAVLIRLEI